MRCSFIISLLDILGFVFGVGDGVVIMGADAGVITTRQDIVKRKARRQKGECEAAQSQAKWSECALTGTPLKAPIVVTRNGCFFNKEELLEAIASRTLPRRFRFASKMKLLREVELLGASSLLEYRCPLSSKSPTPGTVDSWIVLFGCGHFFHGPSFHELKLKECPVCGKSCEEGDVVEILGRK